MYGLLKIDGIPFRNLIVKSCRIIVTHTLFDDPTTYPIKYIEFGDGTTAPTLEDTDLESGHTGSFTVTKTLVTIPNFVYPTAIKCSYNLTTADGLDGQTISEAGLFSNPGDYMFARITFTPFVKGGVDKLFEWELYL